MLVLVVALLAVIALLATTMIVSARYDQVGSQSWVLQHQIEMTFPMLEGYLRGTLTQDMWGHGRPDVAGDAPLERYDATAADDPAGHPWLRGIAGRLIKWQQDAADDPALVQWVVADDDDWIDLPGELTDGLKIRYAFLVVDCNGLANVNTHRHRDWQFTDAAKTIWAFNARSDASKIGAGLDGPHPELGNFWFDFTTLTYAYSTSRSFGAGQPRRGGGPGNLLELGSLLAGGDTVELLDERLGAGLSGRTLDVQSELDLRFPNDSAGGSADVSLAERALPDTFASGSRLRRFFTVAARTANLWPRYEPQPMRPFAEGDPRIEPLADEPTIDAFDLTLLFPARNSVEMNDWYYENNLCRPIPITPGVRTLPIFSGRIGTSSRLDYDLGWYMNCGGGGGWGSTDGGNYLMGHKLKEIRYHPQFFHLTDLENSGTSAIPSRVPPEWCTFDGFNGRSMLPYTVASAMASANLMDDASLVGTPTHAAAKRAMMDVYRAPATHFLMNLIDAVDPQDAQQVHVVWRESYPFQKIANEYLSDYDKGVMGVEVQPFLSEILLYFADDPATPADDGEWRAKPKRVAVELYNPNRRGIELTAQPFGLRAAPINAAAAADHSTSPSNDDVAVVCPANLTDAKFKSIPAGKCFIVYSNNNSGADQLKGIPADAAVYDLQTSINAVPANYEYRYGTPYYGPVGKTSELLKLSADDDLRLLRSGIWYKDRTALDNNDRLTSPDVYHKDKYPAGNVPGRDGVVPIQWHWRWYILDIARTAYDYGALPAGYEALGLRDAFAAAAAATGPLAIRLYRPTHRISRASFLMQTGDWDTLVAAHLGRENVAGAPPNDSRTFIPANMAAAPRFAGDAARVLRHVHPREDDYLAARGDDALFKGRTLTERIERACIAALRDAAGLDPASHEYKRLWQRHEASLYWAPWTPADGQDEDAAERRQVRSRYDFFDSLTAGGAGWDGVDNNRDGPADEHRSSYTGDWWSWVPFYCYEASNCFPLAGRINVNTAPKAVLMCLNLPDVDAGGKSLREAIADTIIATRPHRSMEDLYYHTRTGGSRVGFDWFGFDGVDNHAAAGEGFHFPPCNPDGHVCDGDRWQDPQGLVDDLDERNYLWRLNGELLTTRSDTFAVYLRVQLRSGAGIAAERRVFSIWDRSHCTFAPMKPRRFGGSEYVPNADFIPPARLAIQVFSY